MKAAAFEHLMDAYLDGSISAPQMKELNALLRANADARREFAEMLNVDSALAAVAAGWRLGQEEPMVAKASARSMEWRWGGRSVPRWIATAACLEFLIGGALLRREDSRRVFATVEKAAGVVNQALVEGAPVRGESQHITAGTVSLVSSRGARIVIEAPAEFGFESAQRLHMKRGRLSADVPPAANGFTVITPTGGCRGPGHTLWRGCARCRCGGGACVSRGGHHQGVRCPGKAKPAHGRCREL